MAAPRRNRVGGPDVRDRIQTTQLIKRLQSNGLGKLKKEMSLGQVRSAIALINKVVPDARPEEPSEHELMIALVRRLIVDKAEPETIEGRSVALPALPQPEEETV